MDKGRTGRSRRAEFVLALVVSLTCVSAGALGADPSDLNGQEPVPSAFPPPDTRSSAAASGIPVPSMESRTASSTVSTTAATTTLMAVSATPSTEYRRPWNACRILLDGGGGCVGVVCGGFLGFIVGAAATFASEDTATHKTLTTPMVVGAVLGGVVGVIVSDDFASSWCD